MTPISVAAQDHIGLASGPLWPSAATSRRFRETYWKRRDPTAETDRNEFKETVLMRSREIIARHSIAAAAAGSSSDR